MVQFGEDGVRCMAIAISEPLASFDPANEASKNAPVTWHLAGLLTFCDPPRDDTKDTIARATQYGVPVRMITGDHVLIAKKTCRDLDMGDMSNPAWPNIQVIFLFFFLPFFFFSPSPLSKMVTFF